MAAPRLPPLDCQLAADIEPTGESIGLALTLAAIAHYSGFALDVPVFATGAVSVDGHVATVGHVPQKLAIAYRELAGAPGLVLAPCARGAREHVETVAEAIRVVFGTRTLKPRADLMSATDALAAVEKESDHVASADHLLAVAERPDLSPADRTRLIFVAAVRLRHAGRSSRARELHERELPRIRDERRVIGETLVERYELEVWASRIDDDFDFHACASALEDRLTQPFSLVHNEVRCRGLLAQALAMSGDAPRAIELRELNLSHQRQSDEMRAELPRTLCHLALDSALAGDAGAFDRYAATLAVTCDLGDGAQWRYSTASILRGLVALGRYRDAVEWARDEAGQLCDGARCATDVFRSHSETLTTHPEVSTARALVRALRRLGDVTAAIALADRVILRDNTSDDLVAWLASLVHLEASLARRDAAEVCHANLRELRARLRRCHAAASNAYHELFETSGRALETALDRVWY
ncbi:MAG: hypothetical protein ACHREM_01650 [Polyangiales bacterium]